MDLANYLLNRLQSKDRHFVTSIAKCSLLSLRRDVSIMDEAYTEYLPRVLTICETEKHFVPIEDLVLELPRLVRCGNTLILPKLMMFKDNIKAHIVEALLVAALLNSEIQLHYLSKNVGGDIKEGLSITVKPEWGKELLNVAINSLRKREVGIKTISCNICPLKNICPFNSLGDDLVIPEGVVGIVNDLYNSLTAQITQQEDRAPRQISSGDSLVPPREVTRDTLRDYLNRIVEWARARNRTWVSVAVGKCPVCGRDGTLVVKIADKSAKVLYRHGSSTCTVGTIEESVDKLSVYRFLEIKQ